MNPRFPVYIISKGRYDTRLTSRAFEAMQMPYSIVVEASEYDAYAAVIDPKRIITLDPAYQRAFDTFWKFDDSASKGSGPARNFVWDHAIATGAEWHWVVDDNIRWFARLNDNQKRRVTDGSIFWEMERFVLRYTNIGMAGPNYQYFAKHRQRLPPYLVNSHVYSCNLIRNDLPFRWRGRYNEDADLSLRIMKSGLCTVLFNAFLQDKQTTQSMRGGNTDAFYSDEGTLPKSKMLVEQHPDVARLVWRFRRWHHLVDYRVFRKTKLIRRAAGLSEAVE